MEEMYNHPQYVHPQERSLNDRELLILQAKAWGSAPITGINGIVMGAHDEILRLRKEIMQLKQQLNGT